MIPNYDYFLAVTAPLTVKSEPNLNHLLWWLAKEADFVESNQLSVVSMTKWAGTMALLGQKSLLFQLCKNLINQQIVKISFADGGHKIYVLHKVL